MNNGETVPVTIELFGVPRLRAGVGLLRVDAASVSAALLALGNACPALEGAVVERGRLMPSYRLSLNGERFVSEPETPLSAGDVLLLLSADVGG